MLASSSMSMFSQIFFSNIEIKKLEEKAVNIIRNSFNISSQTQLFATTILEVIDSNGTCAVSPTFDIETKIETYLKNMKVFHYEVFVYDKELKNIYVVNRLFLGKGKFKKDYYLGTKDDFELSKLLLPGKYDYVLKLMDVYSSINNPVFLCFKEDKIKLAYLKDGIIHSFSVNPKDSFIFLNSI